MSLREDILSLSGRFFEERPAPSFVAGETYIPASGKVLDAADLRSLIDSSLDLWLTTGRFAKRFSAALEQRTGARAASLTVSGSAANLLALSALTSPLLGDRRILPGSEVITVAAGFPTTIAPIVQNRCVPVFVDVDPVTHNIDARFLEEARSPRTRAVMVAHALGNPFDLDAVRAFVERHDLFLIEDSCDALGASYGGRPVGGFGDTATLSFYPAHQITTGEGGAVLSRSPLVARAVDSFRDWGRDCWCEPGVDNTCGKRFCWQLGDLPEGYDHKYTYSHLGYNLKMTDMQAAIGCTQIEKLDAFVLARRRNWRALSDGFREAGLDEFFALPEATPRSEPSWFGFLLVVREAARWRRPRIIEYLESRRIGTRLLFAGNMLRQPAFQGVEHRVVGALPATDRAMNDAFWVGVWPGIGPRQIAYMIQTFQDLVRDMRA